jgi:hypothetical protein
LDIYIILATIDFWGYENVLAYFGHFQQPQVFKRMRPLRFGKKKKKGKKGK